MQKRVKIKSKVGTKKSHNGLTIGRAYRPPGVAWMNSPEEMDELPKDPNPHL